ncbi:MAG: hypothetical protein RXR31_01735 [Thermoproteota archaeon]|jgi:hypothetical protein
MKILTDIERINKGIITVYGERGSGKTILSLWIALKKLESKSNIIYLLSNYYSVIEHFKKIEKNIPIEFVEISSIDDIENVIVERGKKGMKNNIIIVDRISIFRLEPYESLESYRKFSILLALIYFDASSQNNLYILNYSDGFGEKAFNIVEYFSNILINTSLQDNYLILSVKLKDINITYNESIILNKIQGEIYGRS